MRTRCAVDWKDHTNVRRYMEQLGVKLGFTQLEDWYMIDKNTLLQNKGLSLLKAYHSSPSLLLAFAYPQHHWAPYRFKSLPNWFTWEKHEDRREYMEWLGTELGFSKMEDWYNIDYSSFQTRHGGTLLSKYANSPPAVVMGIFQDHKWEKFLFNTPGHFYNSPNNQRTYMEWLGDRLGFKSFEDWYKIDAYAFWRNNGRALLSLFNNSPSKVVVQIFNEHAWEMFNFTIPIAYWTEQKNQKEYMDWLGRQLAYTKMEDWYKISAGMIQNNKGGSFLKTYQKSPSKCVMEVYKEHKWNPFMFISVPNNYWRDAAHRTAYVEWLGVKLGFESFDDWYNIDSFHFTNNYGNALLSSYDSPSAVVMDIFKKHEWDIARFSRKLVLKSQAALIHSVSVLFPGHNVLENYRPKLLLTNDGSKPLDFDIFIPSLNLAFEYQGLQHYTAVRSLNAHRHAQAQARDQIKLELCRKEGITLVVIPYWWDKLTISLHATIHESFRGSESSQSFSSDMATSESICRHDLLAVLGPPPDGASLIPKFPTSKNKTQEARRSLVSYYDFGKRIIGRNLITNKGQYLVPPRSFTSKLPSSEIQLYGTLWAGYNKQKEVRRAINSTKNIKEAWANITFFISDCSVPKSYGERLAYLNTLPLPPHAKVVQTVVCQSKEHQVKFHSEIMDKGGKGIAMMSPKQKRLYKVP